MNNNNITNTAATQAPIPTPETEIMDTNASHNNRIYELRLNSEQLGDIIRALHCDIVSNPNASPRATKDKQMLMFTLVSVLTESPEDEIVHGICL